MFGEALAISGLHTTPQMASIFNGLSTSLNPLLSFYFAF